MAKCGFPVLRRYVRGAGRFKTAGPRVSSVRGVHRPIKSGDRRLRLRRSGESSARWTQARLAVAMGVSQQCIQKWLKAGSNTTSSNTSHHHGGKRSNNENGNTSKSSAKPKPDPRTDARHACELDRDLPQSDEFRRSVNPRAYVRAGASRCKNLARPKRVHCRITPRLGGGRKGHVPKGWLPRVCVLAYEVVNFTTSQKGGTDANVATPTVGRVTQ